MPSRAELADVCSAAARSSCPTPQSPLAERDLLVRLTGVERCTPDELLFRMSAVRRGQRAGRRRRRGLGRFWCRGCDRCVIDWWRSRTRRPASVGRCRPASSAWMEQLADLGRRSCMADPLSVDRPRRRASNDELVRVSRRSRRDVRRTAISCRPHRRRSGAARAWRGGPPTTAPQASQRPPRRSTVAMRPNRRALDRGLAEASSRIAQRSERGAWRPAASRAGRLARPPKTSCG